MKYQLVDVMETAMQRQRYICVAVLFPRVLLKFLGRMVVRGGSAELTTC